MPDIITYETLYELLRKEKTQKELQKLDKEFFQNTIQYLKEKQNILTSQHKKEIFPKETEKTQKQLENIKKILKELYERRERKIIDLALISSRTNQKIEATMLPEEEVIFKNLLNQFNNSRENILHSLLSTKLPNNQTPEEPKEIKAENENQDKLVRFLKAVPKFVDQNLNIYGPFEEQDLGYLPKKIAEVLIQKNRAEEIKPKL